MLYTILSVVALLVLWSQLKKRVREHFVQTTTGLNEAEELGVQRPNGKIKGTAVIAGGRFVPFHLTSA
jgi:hypothetical protein